MTQSGRSHLVTLLSSNHMEPRIRLPIPKMATSTTLVSETDDSYALRWFGAGFVVLQIIWLLCQPAYAQGDTGPPGLEGLDELLILLTVYPFLGVGLSFLIFKATGKAWVFFLAPFFFVGLSVVAPVDPTSTQPQSPAFFSLAGVWFYWTHIFAIAGVYAIFRKTKRSWVFFLAPIVGWIIQFISLLFILPGY
jgi:hypothetical protein